MTQLSVSQASRGGTGLSTLQTEWFPVWKTVFLHLFPGLLAFPLSIALSGFAGGILLGLA